MLRMEINELRSKLEKALRAKIKIVFNRLHRLTNLNSIAAV